MRRAEAARAHGIKPQTMRVLLMQQRKRLTLAKKATD